MCVWGGGGGVCTPCVQVLEPANLQRLQRWNYDSQRILIRARSQLPAAEHPAALAAAVQHVSSLTAAACSLVLDGDWHWCADTAQAVGPRLGALDSGFTVCVSLPSPPEPDVLVTVGQLGDAVQRLTVGTLQCSFAVSGCTRASHELMGTFVSSLPDNGECGSYSCMLLLGMMSSTIQQSTHSTVQRIPWARPDHMATIS